MKSFKIPRKNIFVAGETKKKNRKTLFCEAEKENNNRILNYTIKRFGRFVLQPQVQKT